MLLEVKDINVSYGRVQAVNDVSLNVKNGEVVAVLGANGAGKSSLLRAILGIEKAQSGTVSFAGRNISALSPPKRIAAGLALVPEGRRILISQTIHENLLLGAAARSDTSSLETDLDEIYTRFPNLKARRHMAASCLSGGEQQMLAIGRALLAKPKLLMLDEPSLGLSPKIVSEIFALFKELNQSGLSILLVEQNTGKALSLAHRAYVFERGSVATTGAPEELQRDERLTKAYLGG